MPLKVRVKIILILAAIAAGLYALAIWDWSIALAAAVVGLIYLEMIWPRLNYFGTAIQNVKAQGPNAVAITFDDGPSKWTLPILDALRSEKVKATFFLLGKNVERHPEIARAIEKDGHTIGYHGYSHTKYHFKSRKFIREDLDKCLNAFAAAGIKASPLIRFPHGFKNIFAVLEARSRGWTLAAWGKGVWDSKSPGIDLIAERSQKLKAGQILLLHDGDGAEGNPERSQTAQALYAIIKSLKIKDFEFVTLKPIGDVPKSHH